MTDLPPIEDLQKKLSATKTISENIDEPDNSTIKGRSIAMRMVTDLVAGIVVGGTLGYWLDNKLGTYPAIMLVLFVLGMVAGFVNMYRTYIRFSDD